ncbi:hypothetical protein FACS1894111_03570 [Clostridia bacterium]|nr:hypothetical protein FACS1894111_03570 [Clostridia bacterium]
MISKQYVYDLNRVKLSDVLPIRTPYHISVEATFRCNIRCNYCIHAMDGSEINRRGYHQKDMSWDAFERVVSSIHEFEDPIKSVVFSGLGEPLVNKRLPEMVKRVKDTGRVEKILLITNGLLLTHETSDALIDAGLDICKISLQGMSVESYKKICGVKMDWDVFYDNIVYFSEHKNKCLLKAKIGDTALLENDEKLFYEKFSSICDYVDIEHIYPQFDGVDYSETVLADEGKNRFGHSFKQLNVCSPLFYRLYVLQDGRVTFAYPDGITYEGFHLNNMTLRKMWEADETKDMWRNALTHNLSVCQTCPRWSYSAHPDDIIDGFEQEILAKIPEPTKDIKQRQVLCMEI